MPANKRPITGLPKLISSGLKKKKIGKEIISAIKKELALNEIGSHFGIFWIIIPPLAKQMLIQTHMKEAISSLKFSIINLCGSDKIINPITPIKKPIHFFNVIISLSINFARIRTNSGIEAK